MRSKLSVLQRRIAALDKLRQGDTIFTLFDGSRAGIKAKRLLDALLDVVAHRDTPRARIMLQADRASDGSRLHEIAQALHAGPVPPGQLNPDDDEQTANFTGEGSERSPVNLGGIGT